MNNQSHKFSHLSSDDGEIINQFEELSRGNIYIQTNYSLPETERKQSETLNTFMIPENEEDIFTWVNQDNNVIEKNNNPSFCQENIKHAIDEDKSTITLKYFPSTYIQIPVSKLKKIINQDETDIVYLGEKEQIS